MSAAADCTRNLGRTSGHLPKDPKGIDVMTNRTHRRCFVRSTVLACCALLALAAGIAIAQEGFAVRPYKLAHYDFKTDVPEELADEACVRIEQMFAEFQRRSSRLRGRLKKPQPFWLFNNPDDYARAGGPYGTAAVYTDLVFSKTCKTTREALLESDQNAGIRDRGSP